MRSSSRRNGEHLKGVALWLKKSTAHSSSIDVVRNEQRILLKFKRLEATQKNREGFARNKTFAKPDSLHQRGTRWKL